MRERKGFDVRRIRSSRTVLRETFSVIAQLLLSLYGRFRVVVGLNLWNVSRLSSRFEWIDDDRHGRCLSAEIAR